MATQKKDLVELARSLLIDAEAVQGLVDEAGTQLSCLQEVQAPANLRATRRNLIDTAREILTMVSGPADILEQHQVYYQSLACLRWLLEFNVFDHLPQDRGPITYHDLALQTATPLARLQSVMRMTMTSGFFVEHSVSSVGHSQLSLSFASDKPLQDWARFMTMYSAPTASAFADATKRWGDTIALNETAYNVAFNTEVPFFKHVKMTPNMTEHFAGYMQSQARSESGKLDHLVEGFDWAALGENAHVVDIGGSSGQASIMLATAYPNLSFTVQDLPEVITSAPPMSTHLPTSITSRIQFTAHDFFSPQPPISTSTTTTPVKSIVYLLRKIIHDWPAERARVILSQLSAALQASGLTSARLVIMDTILPPPGQLSSAQEAALRVRDLTMAQSFNSKERELVEWEELFGSASPKLVLKAWKQPLGSSMAVMDVRLADGL